MFDTASVRDCADALSLIVAMPYPCWLAGTAVNTAVWTVFSQNVLNEMKLFVFLELLPWRIHVLYSLRKSPVWLRTCMPMLLGSLSIIGCPERLANVTLQKRGKVSAPNPIKGCQLAAIAI